MLNCFWLIVFFGLHCQCPLPAAHLLTSDSAGARAQAHWYLTVPLQDCFIGALTLEQNLHEGSIQANMLKRDRKQSSPHRSA